MVVDSSHSRWFILSFPWDSGAVPAVARPPSRDRPCARSAFTGLYQIAGGRCRATLTSQVGLSERIPRLVQPRRKSGTEEQLKPRLTKRQWEVPLLSPDFPDFF